MRHLPMRKQMFSSVLFRKLFVAVFLVMAGLTAFLFYLSTQEIRQTGRAAAALLGGAAADSLFDRMQAEYDRLAAESGDRTPLPPKVLTALLSGLDFPGVGRLYLVDPQRILAVHPPGGMAHTAVFGILDRCGEPAAFSGGGAVACGHDEYFRMAWARHLNGSGRHALFVVDADGMSRLARVRLFWGAVALLVCGLCLVAMLVRHLLKPLRQVGDRVRALVQRDRAADDSRGGTSGEVAGLNDAVDQMGEAMAEKQRTILAQSAAHDRLVRDLRELRERTKALFRENEKLKRRFELMREKQEFLRRSEERYRTMLENIEEYFYEADLSGNLLFFNDALCRMLGHPREMLTGMNFREFMDRGTAEKAFRIFKKAYETGHSQKGIGWRLVRKDGSTCHVEISVSLIRNLAGEAIGFRGVARNVSDLIYLVYHDSLTGLYNRKAFFERLHETLAVAKRDQKEKNIFYLDLDEFKRVNDEYGHHVGDGVLQEVAVRLKASLRETDHICRIGGDEFVVILNNLKDEARPEEAAGRVLAALSRPYRIEGHLIDFITPSIGISTYPRDSDNVEALIRCADMAMFKAKRKDGGGCFAFYDKTMEEEWRSP
jgi:diguanylate cyclase (GGDEF)-like protein/PAS domain S-box-containing protein